MTKRKTNKERNICLGLTREQLGRNYHTYVIWYYPTLTTIRENHQQKNENIIIWKNNEKLIVCSPYSENIKIYSIDGSCLYVMKKHLERCNFL